MLQYYLISPNFEHRNVVNTVKLGNFHQSFVYVCDNGDSNVESTGPHLASLRTWEPQETGIDLFPTLRFPLRVLQCEKPFSTIGIYSST